MVTGCQGRLRWTVEKVLTALVQPIDADLLKVGSSSLHDRWSCGWGKMPEGGVSTAAMSRGRGRSDLSSEE